MATAFALYLRGENPQQRDQRMKPKNSIIAVSALGLALGVMAAGTARADSFGGAANTFTLDFVNVGNAGNGDDDGAGGG